MKTIGPIKEVNGYPIAKGWFESMAINSDEQDVAALHESWGSADRYRGEECSRCHGRGATRKDQNVGCPQCMGLGVIK
jgi:hypothetical protein